MAKAAKYSRTLRPEEYRDALVTHGRRVANRLALAATPMRLRVLQDFYACYAPESAARIGHKNDSAYGALTGTAIIPALPEQERCITSLINKFDPAAWFVHYSVQQPAALWPEPARPEGDEATTATHMQAAIAQAARRILEAIEGMADEAARDQRGNAMLETWAADIAAKYAQPHDEVFNALVDAVNSVSEV
jgi:hypothetical protein